MNLTITIIILRLVSIHLQNLSLYQSYIGVRKTKNTNFPARFIIIDPSQKICTLVEYVGG